MQVGVPATLNRVDPQGMECILLAITSPSGNRRPPHIHATLPQAEHLRRALICGPANGERIYCPSLLGKDDNGPLTDRHAHAHFIPLDLDGDQHLDHILIHAPGKLCGTTQHAVRSLKRTSDKRWCRQSAACDCWNRQPRYAAATSASAATTGLSTFGDFRQQPSLGK